jgi:hypothetical protein
MMSVRPQEEDEYTFAPGMCLQLLIINLLCWGLIIGLIYYCLVHLT